MALDSMRLMPFLKKQGAFGAANARRYAPLDPLLKQAEAANG